MKLISKSQIADAAGVSYRTFQRWMAQHRDMLLTIGVTPERKLIPVPAVHWICQEYGVDEASL